MKTPDVPSVLIAKKCAGEAAAELIVGGMLVGLGTGSTIAYFLGALAKRCKEGLKISSVATSLVTMNYAKQLGIPLRDDHVISSLDIVVDGADEIDPAKNMIKGGGGALLREKLLATSTSKMVVIVDETKLVSHLGKSPLPVEISPFVFHTTIHRLEQEGYRGVLRLNKEKKPFITDNGNYIFDIQYTEPILDPVNEEKRLKLITGVLETGLFCHLAKLVVIGYNNGQVVQKLDLRE